MAKLVLLTLLVVGVVAEKVRYDNYQMYRVMPTNEEHLAKLRELEHNTDGLMFWTGVGRNNTRVVVMVSPDKVSQFKHSLLSVGLDYELTIENLQSRIDLEDAKPISESFDWTDYYPLDHIYSWLDGLVEQYPQIVTTIIGGTSYEQRQIKGVKVSYKSGNPGVFIEGGIHAREWISPATVTYILNQLLTSSDPVVRDIAENYDWYIFPSVNPDGYEYTHTTDRCWRKNRRPLQNGCVGVDLNRNWGFHWIDTNLGPCELTYAGPNAFSEIESRTLSEYIASISSEIQVYLSFHSYSQLILLPYGYTDKPISNYDTLMTIGTRAAIALASKYGTQYTVGNVVNILYPASGGSMDWVRGNYDTPIVYTFELRDTGKDEFELPTDQIIPSGEETLDAVVSILTDAKRIVSNN